MYRYVLSTVYDGVTEIGGYAFIYCSSLTSIEIPSSVTEIGDGAFYGCSALTSIEIPASVTEIGGWTFYDCSALTSIEILGSMTECNISFSECDAMETVKVPVGSRSADAWWGEKVQIISVFYGPEDRGCTWYKIPRGAMEIAEGAFRDCSSLTGVEIPKSVTEIGADAFKNCSSLTGLKIPHSVTEIGDGAFSGCDALETIDVPEGMDVSNWGLGTDVQIIYY